MQLSSDLRAKYEPVIGLEVHVQLLTVSKIFCSCSTRFGNPPNTNVCPVCLGLPGVLPVLNRKAVDFAVLAAMALNCCINEISIFARKNYFYPDLPKGYQISQYDRPLAEFGSIKVPTAGGEKKIGITRVHLEEDAGKSLHEGFPDSAHTTAIDLNRTGVPLIEIVSEPDIATADEAYEYLTRLKEIILYMESGSDIAKNYARMLPIAEAADDLVRLKANPKVSFEAYTGLVSHGELVSVLGGLHWMTPAYFQPDLNFLKEMDEGYIDDWLVILPLKRDYLSTTVMLPSIGRRSVFERNRQEGKSFGAIAEPQHREPVKFIAGVDLVGVDDEVIRSYASTTRGGVLLYPVVTKGHPKVKLDALDPSDVFMCFELWAPLGSCAPGSRLVQFRVRNLAHREEAIVDTPSRPPTSAAVAKRL